MCQTFSALPVSEALTSTLEGLLIGGRCRYLHRHAVLCSFILHLFIHYKFRNVSVR